MDEILRKTFINCYAYLVENIQYENLSDFLLQYEVIPKATIEDINSLPNRRQKVRKLLDILPRRSNKAFYTFLQCLEITDQVHIAQTLMDRLNEIGFQKGLNANNGFLPGPQESQYSSASASQCEVLQQKQLGPPKSTESDKAGTQQAPPAGAQCLGPDPQQSTEVEMETDRDCYEMKSHPRGYMLIINNEKFSSPLDDRSGSSKDASDLQTLFWGLGFYCDIKHNLKVEEMKLFLSDFSQMDDHKSMSCCAVVLMSHGDEDPEDHVYGTGGNKVSVNELIIYFNDQNCPNLKDKPKLFIVQACRNTGSSSNNSPTPRETRRDLSVENDDASTNKTAPLVMRLLSLDLSSDAVRGGLRLNMNSRADMLIAYSTAQGNKSFRHKKTGSIFIQTIIEVFKTKARTTSVTDMLIEVNRKLREEYPRQGQIGVPEVALTKKWFLKPKQ